MGLTFSRGGMVGNRRRYVYTLYAIWSKPLDSDIDAFENHYTGLHAPLAAKVPNLRRFLTTRTSEGLAGSEPAFYRVAEMSFQSQEALVAAEQSPQWADVREDAASMIEQFGVTMSVALGFTDQKNGGTL